MFFFSLGSTYLVRRLRQFRGPTDGFGDVPPFGGPAWPFLHINEPRFGLVCIRPAFSSIETTPIGLQEIV